MTDLAASLSRTTNAARSDLLEVALLSLGGLLLSFVLLHYGFDLASALQAAS
jgi:hypothetical protein